MGEKNIFCSSFDFSWTFSSWQSRCRNVDVPAQPESFCRRQSEAERFPRESPAPLTHSTRCSGPVEAAPAQGFIKHVRSKSGVIPRSRYQNNPTSKPRSGYSPAESAQGYVKDSALFTLCYKHSKQAPTWAGRQLKEQLWHARRAGLRASDTETCTPALCHIACVKSRWGRRHHPRTAALRHLWVSWTSCRGNSRATVYPGKSCQLCVLGVHMYSSILSGHTTVHRCVSYTNLNADGAYGLVTHCIAALYALRQYVSLCSSAIALIFVVRSNVLGENKTKNWMTSVHNTKSSCSDIRSTWNFWLAHRYLQIWVWWGSTALAAFQLRWWWEGRKWFPALLWQIVLITEDVTVIEGFKQKKACASWNKPVFFLFFFSLKNEFSFLR